ncbi:hypothetical protein PCL_02967 [Purpureocillium lilacinum]|uniref:Enolase n=1 Tax=Purpureocillium lilacinum TaxID=33203 RepID=A0A2U3DZE6_PURLI|nr:hypothetical protein PCL_02967 [Purpureocillium lilacinum]
MTRYWEHWESATQERRVGGWQNRHGDLAVGALDPANSSSTRPSKARRNEISAILQAHSLPLSAVHLHHRYSKNHSAPELDTAVRDDARTDGLEKGGRDPAPARVNDDEFLLDAQDATPSETPFVASQDPEGDDAMAIDEEGRPRFAPARDIDPVTRVETRKIPVPPHRMTPLKQAWPSIYPPLVEHLKLQCRMNIKRKTVELRTSKHTVDTGALQKGEDFVKAFTLGFEVDDAVALLRLDDLYIETFEIKDVRTMHGDSQARAIGRIAGKDGKTKFAIENASRTRIVLADSKIHILGGFKNIHMARESVVSLILGKPPGKVYALAISVRRQHPWMVRYGTGRLIGAAAIVTLSDNGCVRLIARASGQSHDMGAFGWGRSRSGRPRPRVNPYRRVETIFCVVRKRPSLAPGPTLTVSNKLRRQRPPGLLDECEVQDADKVDGAGAVPASQKSEHCTQLERLSTHQPERGHPPRPGWHQQPAQPGGAGQKHVAAPFLSPSVFFSPQQTLLLLASQLSGPRSRDSCCTRPQLQVCRSVLSQLHCPSHPDEPSMPAGPQLATAYEVEVPLHSSARRRRRNSPPPRLAASRQFFKMAVTKVHARSVYDSRGNPTVEVDVVTETGLHRAIVPSGASTGQHEACELRDGDKSKWGGKGVTKAVDNVNTVIGPALIKENLDVKDQSKVDAFLNGLDGTPNKTKLGANAILGVSLAIAKAGAAEKGVPLYAHISDLAGTKKPYVLPVPFMNVLNGGSHAGGRLAFQEFMIVPSAAPSFSEAMRQGAEVYQQLKSLAKKKYGQSAGNVGDEGGVAPDIQTAAEALDLITEAIEKAGYTGKMNIAMDVASSEFYKEAEKKYDLDFKNPESDPTKWITYEELAAMYSDLCKKYPIVSIEDPFAEDDWEAWSYFYKSENIQIVGDDLTVTNPLRIKKAIDLKACNALLLKVNQIGTLTESIQAAKDSYADGWGVMVSHRSGETEDVTIADIVVGIRSGEIKTGAPCRSERLAKLNQILRIEEELGDQAIYAGANFRTSVNL